MNSGAVGRVMGCKYYMYFASSTSARKLSESNIIIFFKQNTFSQNIFTRVCLKIKIAKYKIKED